MNKRKLYSILVKSALLVCFILGMQQSVLAMMRSLNRQFCFFTIQSNILISLTTLVFLIYEIMDKTPTQRMRVIKFAFTVAITVTGLVFNFILYPQSLGGPNPYTPLKVNSIYVHIFVPVLSIVDYIIFEYDFESTWKTAGWAIVYPLFYCGFTYFHHFLFNMEFKAGQYFPYFFLNYVKYGWFGFKPLGVFWWIIIIVILVFGLGAIYLSVKYSRKKAVEKKAAKAAAAAE